MDEALDAHLRDLLDHRQKLMEHSAMSKDFPTMRSSAHEVPIGIDHEILWRRLFLRLWIRLAKKSLKNLRISWISMSSEDVCKA